LQKRYIEDFEVATSRPFILWTVTHSDAQYDVFHALWHEDGVGSGGNDRVSDLAGDALFTSRHAVQSGLPQSSPA
jgi:hypothetical protein